MGKRNSKAYAITREDLERAGFYACDYDPANDVWIIKRHWYISYGHAKKSRRNVAISETNDCHKYGKRQKAKVINYSMGGTHVCTTLGRFVWAWHYGEVSVDDQIKKIGQDHSLASYAKQSVHDHTGYKRSNQYICVKDAIAEALEEYKKKLSNEIQQLPN